MKPVPGVFPTRDRLWRGAHLGSLIHAIMTARYPELVHEQSWDGINYNIQDSAGSRGTITFGNDVLVAAFFLEDSRRSPFARTGPRYRAEDWLDAMPPAAAAVARQEAFQYLLQEIDGTTEPIVTSVFWAIGEATTAVEAWSQVFDHGARLARVQCLETDEALDEWAASYEMPVQVRELARALFERKIAAPAASIRLELHEWELIVSQAVRTEDAEVSRTALAEVGITAP